MDRKPMPHSARSDCQNWAVVGGPSEGWAGIGVCKRMEGDTGFSSSSSSGL